MPIGLSLYENEPPERYRLLSGVGNLLSDQRENRERPTILAVSGGGDSVAMLRLGHHVASTNRTNPLWAVTVDHGLRPDSRAEAEWVARLCGELGVPHKILSWDTPSLAGNLQHNARQARYRLLADWARAYNALFVGLGHTSDDRAETLIMQMTRAAGVEGLAGMSSGFERDGVRFVRPMDRLARVDLRNYLREIGQDWIEDPSNDDSRYHRIRIRKAMPILADLGLTVDALCKVAENLASANETIARMLAEKVASLAMEDRGDLTEDSFDLTGELWHRFWLAAFQWIGGGDYPPRASDMRDCMNLIRENGSATLAGCLVTFVRGPNGLNGTTRITREYNAVRDLTCPTTEIWDGRWQFEGPHDPALHIGALGDAVKDCPDWRTTGLPRASLLASPAIWRGSELIAAPLTGNENGWKVRIVADFNSFLLSH